VIGEIVSTGRGCALRFTPSSRPLAKLVLRGRKRDPAGRKGTYVTMQPATSVDVMSVIYQRRAVRAELQHLPWRSNRDRHLRNERERWLWAIPAVAPPPPGRRVPPVRYIQAS
jgi:hypothetical protein